MNAILAKYCIPLIKIKVVEFIVCSLIAAALIVAAPGAFYAKVDALGALHGGLIFAGLFFALTLYPVLSAVLFLILAGRTTSKTGLASISSVFMLAYSAYFALNASKPFPVSFWIAWICMGVATFLITIFVIRKAA